MKNKTNQTWEEVPGCVAVKAKHLVSEKSLQVLEVKVEKGGEIPMHSHSCAATMVVIEGSAKAIGHNERSVKKGDVIIKKAQEPHGFTSITEPFVFISISDGEGIMHDHDWDIKYN